MRRGFSKEWALTDATETLLAGSRDYRSLFSRMLEGYGQLVPGALPGD